MKKTIGIALLALTPLAQAIEYREELAPPNVAFFVELLGTRTDYNNLGGDDAGGFRLRLGLDLKDVKVGGWMLRAEGALNQFGQTRKTITSSIDPIPGIDPPNVDQIIVDVTNQLRLSGIEGGLRLYDNRFFYVRGGAFVYSLKSRREETRTDVDINGDPISTNEQTPQEETISGIGPYLGAGVEFQLVESVKGVAEFNVYQADGEMLNNLSLGFRFSF
ncbi:hypothetical protein [Alcanivorax sp. 1008]|uniref:hypothetical protein n=1 Tax=Alcanivorax sp. 1008 TaxID=2816853 RepID=UPI001DF4CAC4|nr:hypothetical protein [Alcanivorax sp. 1008]MCC1497122.1 hypothetical protein [Alcanivorax sp. 1008]